METILGYTFFLLFIYKGGIINKQTEAATSSLGDGLIQALLNGTSNLAVIIDTEGIILNISNAAAQRVGKQKSQLLNTCIFDYFPPREVGFKKAHVECVKQSGEPMYYEEQFRGLNLLVCIYPIINNLNNNKSDEVTRLVVSVSDNTQLKKKESLLDRYTQILATINDPILYIDKNLLFRAANNAALALFQKKRSQVLGKHIEEILSEDVLKKGFKLQLIKCFGGEKVYAHDWYRFPDGKRRFMYLNFYPLFAKERIVSGAVVNAVDVTQMKRMEDELKRLSETDHLTQICNRKKFHDALEDEVLRVRRYGPDLSLIMFDIDHFKRVNDTFGHDTGDEVLVTLTQLISANIRETDIFARWGGEEFMILLRHTDIAQAIALAEGLRKEVAKKEFNTVGSITSSFGVTQFGKLDTGDTFVKRVDQALYKAKESGRNCVIQARINDDWCS